MKTLPAKLSLLSFLFLLPFGVLPLAASAASPAANATGRMPAAASPGLLSDSGPLSEASARFIPPKNHPRLYIRPSEVPELKSRMETRQGKAIIRELEKCVPDRTPGQEAAEKDRGFRYYFKMRGVTSKVQLQALRYLTDGDRGEARSAITSMLDTLRKTNFGRKNDLSRASGVMLMVGAMVYDWCYPELTASEKEAYVNEFVRIAGTMECGYPPKRNEPIAGHSSEWMILRDMLSAGIAIYDEYPDMYNHVINLLTEDYVPPRNFIYHGGNYHQGTGYVTVRFSNDLICQWIMRKMGYKDFFHPSQRYVMYDFLYRRRPDGQVLPAGDVNHNRTSAASYALPSMLAASYYSDPYLQYEFERKMSLEPHCLMFRLLWQDFDLAGKAPDDLPLSRFSGKPFGWMIARTSWGADAVIAEMKINENFVGNHQHLDGGAFQIYHKGPLAIDSGLYQGTGGGYNSANNKNYTKRTIAHNSILIYDPDEVFETWNYGGADKTPVAANDGGQRMPGKGWDTCRSFEDLLGEEYTVGETIAHGFGPDRNTPEYTYLKGDITKAYSSKVKDVRRSFVFLNMLEEKIPAVLAVFDRVVSKDASFKKFWLLHSIEEPEIGEGCFTVKRTLDGDSGMLRCDMLYPAASITKTGGEGREFWVFGQNYPSYPTANRPDTAKEYGQWRVEESPLQAAQEDIFLNVIQIAGNDCKDFHKVGKIDGERAVGAVVGDRAVVFSRDGGRIGGEFAVEVPQGDAKTLKILVTDLEPGKWKIIRSGKVLKGSVSVPEESQVLYFRGQGGEYIFRKLP